MKKRAQFAKVDSIVQYCSTCLPKLERKPTRKRKVDGEISTMRKAQKRANCFCKTARPYYGFPNDIKPLYCFKCKLVGMVKLYKPPNKHIPKKCQVCNIKYPSHHRPGEKLRFCSTCRPPDATISNEKKCVMCDVKKARFNFAGQKSPFWCKQCCPDSNMVDIATRRCLCGKIPSFAERYGQPPKWCKTCVDIPESAVNVSHKLCRCGNPAYFKLGDEKQKYCKTCAPKGARSINCGMCDCGKYATHTLPYDRKALFCATCKPENAIFRARCCPCGVKARFGLPCKQATACSICRASDMIYMPTKRCDMQKCKKFALYGTYTSRKHCEEHKQEGEFNLIEKKCQGCELMEVLSSNNLCTMCEPSVFMKYVKREEDHVRKILDAHKMRYIGNRIVSTASCGKERPDFVFEFITHNVILEVDEYQHRSYNCLCEQVRMINITQAFGGTPIFWIRYCPHEFIPANSFAKSTISKTKREAHLLEWLQLAFKRDMHHLAEVVYLFYDGTRENVSEHDIQVLSEAQFNY